MTAGAVMPRSVRCVVCGRKARVTKLDTLARHRDEYGHVCDNTGVSRVSPHDSPRDLVKVIGAGYGLAVTDDEADFVLWECTPFPFGTLHQWVEGIASLLHTQQRGEIAGRASRTQPSGEGTPAELPQTAKAFRPTRST